MTRFALKKHVLMLTAATAALLSGQALADTTITTAVTTAQATSSGGNITIGTTGSIVITAGSPALTINSSNSVVNSGAIKNTGTTSAIGVQIDGGFTGQFDDAGTMDLSGTGSSKTGISITGAGSFVGTAGGIAPIDIETGSSLSAVGDGSYGIHLALGTTLDGSASVKNFASDTYGNALFIGGNIGVANTSATSTAAANTQAVRLEGNVIGNITIGPSGVISGLGAGTQGLVILGTVTGYLSNGHIIETTGTASPVALGGNPEAGSALIVANNITGGIYNAGSAGSGDTTAPGSISTIGGSTSPIGAPAVLISSAFNTLTGVPVEIGTYTDQSGQSASFLNRGFISASSQDAGFSPIAMRVEGVGPSLTTTLDSIIYNSGTINATGLTSTISAQVSAVGISIGNYATVPGLNNSSSASAATGTIVAVVSGTQGGVATGVFIDSHGSLASITNSGVIAATSTTSNAAATLVGAYGIWDVSGTLSSITNSGTIASTISALSSPTVNTNFSRAVDVRFNTTGVVFNNTGIVAGDVMFGTGPDTLNVTGGVTPATVTGNISFGGTSGVPFSSDNLIVGTNATVTGGIIETGTTQLNVLVQGGGTLNLTNGPSAIPLSPWNTGLLSNNFNVNAVGTLGLKLSQTFNFAANPAAPAIITAATEATLTNTSILNVTFGSFLSTPGAGAAQFVLIDSPSLTIDNLPQLQAGICSSTTIPWLFQLGSGCLTQVNTVGDSKLILTLTPKTAAQLNLTGYAKQMFPLANIALASDNELGGAVISGILSDADAQRVYQSFAPDVTGSARAVAISLTDQATGPVGARQRVLRMYAGQPGEATLWGQEFTQNLNQDATLAATGYRDTGFGFALGLDSGDPRNGRYGAAFTFFSGGTTEKDPGNAKNSSEWYMASVYSDWRGRGLFFDSNGTVGYGMLDGKRELIVGGVARTAEGKRSSLLASGGFSTGVVLASGATTITPQFSLDALTLREEGYSEGGGAGINGTIATDGYDLKVAPYYTKSVRAYVGTSFRQDIRFGDFYLQPEARIGYRYDFVADASKLKAQFLCSTLTAGGCGATAFTMTGPDPAKGNLIAGASISATTGSWSIGLNYDYLRGTGGTAGSGTSSGRGVSQQGMITLVGRI